MNNSLVHLLKIRELRKLTAATHLHHCRIQLQRGRQQRQQQQAHWAKYHRWRMNQEKALFQTLQNKSASSRELDSYRAELVALRNQEHVLTMELRQTDQMVETANQALFNARSDLQKASKAKEKLLVHVAICERDTKFHQEHQEEREYEECNLCSGQVDFI